MLRRVDKVAKWLGEAFWALVEVLTPVLAGEDGAQLELLALLMNLTAHSSLSAERCYVVQYFLQGFFWSLIDKAGAALLVRHISNPASNTLLHALLAK